MSGRLSGLPVERPAGVRPHHEDLRQRGASAETAALAPQLALACYKAGHEIAAGDPDAL
ncbi:hypothetical protein [Streptosporangium subroseum]|uniref:hypothetical protein n=1 Tax=Streptosporangium subroseum TaxID=106412 RepID=UPI00308DC59A|nr:hypothetical protein OHB15_39665 [Streptosporangium subroseum]